ncbi:hypothetical protein D3C86_1659460 [compost metagenome]
MKLAEGQDAYILRVHEFAGISGEMEVISDASIASWQECDLLERPISELRNESIIQVNIKPYEIRTFIIRFNK